MTNSDKAEIYRGVASCFSGDPTVAQARKRLDDRADECQRNAERFAKLNAKVIVDDPVDWYGNDGSYFKNYFSSVVNWSVVVPITYTPAPKPPEPKPEKRYRAGPYGVAIHDGHRITPMSNSHTADRLNAYAEDAARADKTRDEQARRINALGNELALANTAKDDAFNRASEYAHNSAHARQKLAQAEEATAAANKRALEYAKQVDAANAKSASTNRALDVANSQIGELLGRIATQNETIGNLDKSRDANFQKLAAMADRVRTSQPHIGSYAVQCILTGSY